MDVESFEVGGVGAEAGQGHVGAEVSVALVDVTKLQIKDFCFKAGTGGTVL